MGVISQSRRRVNPRRLWRQRRTPRQRPGTYAHARLTHRCQPLALRFPAAHPRPPTWRRSLASTPPSGSTRPSGRPETSPAPSRRSPRASSGATSTRRSSASPAPARPSRIANVIEQTRQPTLVIAHNKTLAAQLYARVQGVLPRERRRVLRQLLRLLPARGLHPASDTYIEKDAAINEEIDRLRHGDQRARQRPARRDDRRLVSASTASARPRSTRPASIQVRAGERRPRRAAAEAGRHPYERNDVDFRRGTFRVRGDVVEVFPAYEENGLRIEFWGDEVERISRSTRCAARSSRARTHADDLPRRRTT